MSHRRNDDGRNDEVGLFEREMADVHRLEKDQPVPKPSRRQAVTIPEHEREALALLDGIVSGEQPFELGDSEEYIEGRVPGISRRVLRSLHAGEFTVQADLDLHGHVARDARVAVEQFVRSSHRDGLRCVRIVHGRGKNSPDGEPVLKTSLPRWLARGPARHIVLAFATAAPHDGGAGATYVLLRRGRGRGEGRRPPTEPL